jgi:hypothetical protein
VANPRDYNDGSGDLISSGTAIAQPNR